MYTTHLSEGIFELRQLSQDALYTAANAQVGICSLKGGANVVYSLQTIIVQFHSAGIYDVSECDTVILRLHAIQHHWRRKAKSYLLLHQGIDPCVQLPRIRYLQVALFFMAGAASCERVADDLVTNKQWRYSQPARTSVDGL